MTNRTSFRLTYEYEEAETKVWHHSLMCGGSISVCERRTGYGYMDEETGYRSPCGQWWLATGHNDIRAVLHRLDSEEAMIAWVMDRADIGGGYRPNPGVSYEQLMRHLNWKPQAVAA